MADSQKTLKPTLTLRYRVVVGDKSPKAKELKALYDETSAFLFRQYKKSKLLKKYTKQEVTRNGNI